MLDLVPLAYPTRNNSPHIPPKLNIGTLLISRRHGVKCILLEFIEELAHGPQQMLKLEMGAL